MIRARVLAIVLIGMGVSDVQATEPAPPDSPRSTSQDATASETGQAPEPEVVAEEVAPADPLRGGVVRSSLKLERPRPGHDNSDRMLRFAGALITGLGAALAVPMTVALVERGRADRRIGRIDDGEASDGVQRRPGLVDRKRQMTQMALGTGIASVAYLVTGLALLGLAAKKRQTSVRRTSVTPIWGRAMAGVRLETRF